MSTQARKEEKHLFRYWDEFGNTVLHDVIHGQNKNTLELLLKKGADPNIKNKKSEETPLHIVANKAYDKASHEMIKILLDYKADPNVQNKRKTTPLHWAVNAGSIGITTLLLEAKANPNIQDIEGNSPLHWAMETLDDRTIEGVIEKLFKHGADAMLQNNNKETPFDLANKIREKQVRNAVVNLFKKRMEKKKKLQR